MAITTSLSTITLYVDELNSPRDKEWLNWLKKQQHKTHLDCLQDAPHVKNTDWMWKPEKRDIPCNRNPKKVGLAMLIYIRQNTIVFETKTVIKEKKAIT